MTQHRGPRAAGQVRHPGTVPRGQPGGPGTAARGQPSGSGTPAPVSGEEYGAPMSDSSSMRPTTASVDAFLSADDPDGSLARLDAVITGALPGASRVLWQGVFWGGTEQSIIGYGHIVQPRPRGKDVEWFLVGLARQRRHLSLYVNAAEDGIYLAKSYGQRLGRTKVGSASISFASADDVDLTVLDELVRHAGRLVEWS